VPPEDYEPLKRAGAAAIFPPGTVVANAAEALLDKLRPGGGQTAAE
jgi:methylmalonyl-CoA mutase